MKMTFTLAALLCLATATLHAQHAPLFRMTSNNGYVDDNRQPAMVFQEIERSDGASTVEVVQTSGSVDGKLTFVLRGSCALMKDRGQQAFEMERLPGATTHLIVRFVSAEGLDADDLNHPPVEGSVVSAAKCDLIDSILAPLPRDL